MNREQSLAYVKKKSAYDPTHWVLYIYIDLGDSLKEQKCEFIARDLTFKGGTTLRP